MDFGAKGNSKLGTIPVDMKQQSSRGALRKRCPENIRQIYRRTPMLKCDFNKAAKQHSIFSNLCSYNSNCFYGADIKIAVYSKFV